MGTHSDGKKVTVGGFNGNYFTEKARREQEKQAAERAKEKEDR